MPDRHVSSRESGCVLFACCFDVAYWPILSALGRGVQNVCEVARSFALLPCSFDLCGDGARSVFLSRRAAERGRGADGEESHSLTAHTS